MRAGFKLSTELLQYLSGLHLLVVREAAEGILTAVRESVGDHVRHNVYFRGFPRNNIVHPLSSSHFADRSETAARLAGDRPATASAVWTVFRRRTSGS